MAFTQTTLGDVRKEILARLGEFGSGVFFSYPEIDQTIVDTLYMWGAVSDYYRDDKNYALSPESASLSTVSDLVSVTDFDIISLIRARLMEMGETTNETFVGGQPLVATTLPIPSWLGPMWEMHTVLKVIEHRRDRFLADTGIVVTSSSINIDGSVTPVRTIELSEEILDVRRMVLRTQGTGVPARDYPLHSTDTMSYSGYDLTDQTPQPLPKAYSIIGSGPFKIQLHPTYNGPAASLQLHTINAGAQLTGNGPYQNKATGLGIPSDYVWGIVWGVIADLLGGHNDMADPPRAQLAMSLYELSVSVAKARPRRITSASLNGQPLKLTNFYDLDTATPGWEMLGSSTPRVCATSGDSIVSVYPRPSVRVANPQGSPTTYDSVIAQRITPPPILYQANLCMESGILPIGREELSGVVEWCLISLLFKCGAFEVQQQQEKAQRIFANAAQFNSRLRQHTPDLLWQRTDELTRRPYQSVEMAPATVEGRQGDQHTESNRRRRGGGSRAAG